LVPVKLTSCPSASNLYRDAPVGLISTSRPAPPVPEMKVKDPSGCFLKLPGWMVVVKVPT
jgi:hypothetical protein